MTAEEFNIAWSRTYPDTAIEPQLLQLKGHPWFRIHSLPKSKRYATTESEWEILLARHNQIFSEVFGEGSSIFLVTGDHRPPPGFTELHPLGSVAALQKLELVALEPVDLHAVASTFDKGQSFIPMIAAITWRSGAHDDVLRVFADDELDGFFVRFDSETIIAPYDGGIDFFMKDEASRDHWKNVYKEWLSPRTDGM